MDRKGGLPGEGGNDGHKDGMDKFGLKKNENQEMTNIKDFYGVK